MLNRLLPAGRPLHVCVIGAGVAGLRASDVLLQHGVKVTILEARSRIGGRVAQSDYLGPTVDLGANWIHGTENNPIYDIAKATRTVLHYWPEHQVCFDEDGIRVSDSDTSEASDAFWGIISDAFHYSKQNSASIPASVSLMDFVQHEAKKKLADEPEDSAENKRRFIIREAEIWGAFVGSPMEKQSLKYFWLEECIEGANPFVAGTFSRILDTISRAALAGATLKLEHVVNSIRTPGSDNESVTVGAANGIEQDFDEVIVTCPLGWLKRNQSVFEPPLPSSLSTAIDSMGYGNLDKVGFHPVYLAQQQNDQSDTVQVYLTFPSAFWDEPPTLAGTPIDTEAQQLPNTKIAPLHHHNHNPPAAPQAHHASSIHWYKPRYAKDTNPHEYVLEAISMSALPGKTSHPTLLFYIYGPCSTHIAALATPTQSTPNAQTQAQAQAQAQESLTAFFKPYYSLLPNYNAANPACTPTRTLATAWAADPHAGHGSYSNFPTGLTHGDAHILAMRHGLPERRLWFAGEHTGPFDASGTVTGAYVSGEAVGRRICAAYGILTS